MSTRVTNIILPPASAFSATPVVSVGENVVFGLMEPTVLPSNTDWRATVGQADENRIDRIAARHLGDSRYWWAIAQLNNMIDPLTEVVAGTVIKVPDRQSLPT